MGTIDRNGTKSSSPSVRRDSRHSHSTFHLRRRYQPPHSSAGSPQVLPHRWSLISAQRHACRYSRRIATSIDAKQHRHHDLVCCVFRPHTERIRDRWLWSRSEHPKPHQGNSFSSREGWHGDQTSQRTLCSLRKIPEANRPASCDRGSHGSCRGAKVEPLSRTHHREHTHGHHAK